MALSFGRGKQGDTNEAGPAPSGDAEVAASTEGLDESWFETALEEEAAGAPVSPFAAPPVPSAYVAPEEESASDFDIFAELEAPPSRPTAHAQSPASFDMADLAPIAAPPASAAFGVDSTPFDNAASNAPAVPAKAKGGLKKVLPALALVAVLGGGAYFWISMRDTGSEEGDSMSAAPRPAPKPIAPAPVAKPTIAKPTAAKPSVTAPAPAATETPIKHDIGKLWFEGANALHAGNKALARKKWHEAVKLAKSKPGYEQSAKMVQDALDKLK